MSEIPSMKLDPKAEEFRKGRIELSSGEYQEYPYGLCIRLEDEQIEKLGFHGMPRIGDKFYLKGFVEVKELGEHSSEHEGKERNMSLQITHMGLKHVEQEREADQVFYGDAPKPKVI